MNTISEAIAAASVLGINITSDRDVVAKVRHGLPSRALRNISKKLKVSHPVLALALNIPERTLMRRFKEKTLPQAESDRLYRIARILHSATDAVGNEKNAAQWMLQKNRALGGVAPLQLLDTEAGAREVESVLGHIRYGDTFV